MPNLSAEDIQRRVDEAAARGDVRQLHAWAGSAATTSLPQRASAKLLEMQIEIARSAETRAWWAVAIAGLSLIVSFAGLFR